MINFKQLGLGALGRNSIKTIYTGLKAFDEATDGLVSGRLYVVSAASGCGKTTLLTSIMAEAAIRNHEKKFLFIATEQTAAEIQVKLLANRSGVSTYELQHWDDLPWETHELLERYNNQLDNVWFEYYDSADFNLEQCLEDAYAQGIEYVFYDYLGAIANLDDSKEWRSLEMLTDKLKRWATTHNTFVFTATQCSNDIKTLKTEPEIYDERFIANSKGIARKADVGFVMVRHNDGLGGSKKHIYLDMYKNRNMESPKRLSLVVDYARNRVTDEVKLF